MSGAQRQTRRAWLVGLALVSGLLVLAGSVLAQGLRPNERELKVIEDNRAVAQCNVQRPDRRELVLGHVNRELRERRVDAQRFE